MPNNLAAVALDAAPPAAELLAAKAEGMSWRAWCDAGKPVSAAFPARGHGCHRKAAQPSVRPYAPYRSKWEADYARYLESLRVAGFILASEYEPESLVIGVGAKYTPDFRVTRNDGATEWREVKGFRREAAIVRIKAAALRYPDQRFVLVTKLNGQWKHTTIGAPR